MAIPNKVEEELKKFFAKLSAVNTYSNVNGDGNKFELYVYTLVYKAVPNKFKIRVEQLSSTNEFIFRCSPGHINSKYSYFSLDGKRGRYELRNGIEVDGHSMEHEIDVLIINALPFGFTGKVQKKDLKLALECKSYGKSSSLKGEVRKFLGAMSDLSNPITYSSPTPHAGCIHLGFTFDMGFVTNMSIVPKLMVFLEAYNLNPRFDIVPYSSSTNQFVRHLKQKIASLT